MFSLLKNKPFFRKLCIYWYNFIKLTLSSLSAFFAIELIYTAWRSIYATQPSLFCLLLLIYKRADFWNIFIPWLIVIWNVDPAEDLKIPKFHNDKFTSTKVHQKVKSVLKKINKKHQIKDVFCIFNGYRKLILLIVCDHLVTVSSYCYWLNL